MEGWERIVRITTPEGVEVRLSAAGVGTRSLAFLIDYTLYALVVSSVAGLLLNLLTLGRRSAEAVGAATLALSGFFFLGFLLYHALCIGLARGQTPGKKALRIRVVREDGGSAGMGRALARTLLLIVDALLVGAIVGTLSILFNSRGKRLGDLVSGTMVVREAEQPHGLARRLWLTGIPVGAVSGWDTSAIDADMARLIEDYCGRRLELTEGPRRALGARLADVVRRSVPGVPPHLHGEAVLEGAILARWARTAPPAWAAAPAWGQPSPWGQPPPAWGQPPAAWGPPPAPWAAPPAPAAWGPPPAPAGWGPPAGTWGPPPAGPASPPGAQPGWAAPPRPGPDRDS